MMRNAVVDCEVNGRKSRESSRVPFGALNMLLRQQSVNGLEERGEQAG